MTPSGTTCLSTSHLRRHSRFSDNDSRPFCFSFLPRHLSYDLCVTIIPTIPHYTVRTPVVLAIINILGNVKNVCDDDDDTCLWVTLFMCRYVFRDFTPCSARWDVTVGSTYAWKRPIQCLSGYRENGEAPSGELKTQSVALRTRMRHACYLHVFFRQHARVSKNVTNSILNNFNKLEPISIFFACSVSRPSFWIFAIHLCWFPSWSNRLFSEPLTDFRGRQNTESFRFCG